MLPNLSLSSFLGWGAFGPVVGRRKRMVSVPGMAILRSSTGLSGSVQLSTYDTTRVQLREGREVDWVTLKFEVGKLPIRPFNQQFHPGDASSHSKSITSSS